MRTRPLGTTGLEVSELSLGTWGLSGEAYGPVTDADAKAIILRARAMGINLFETSTSYGQGAMERALGDTLGSDGDAIVVTKVGTDRNTHPARKRFDEEYLERTVTEARERLGAGPKLVALLHNPSAAAVKAGAGETLARLTRDGVLTSWGASVGALDVAESALDAGAPVLSFAYNILQVEPLRALTNRLTESRTGVLAHSVLGYGLLAGRWSPTKQFRYGDHRAERWPEGTLAQRIRLLDAIRPMVSGDVVTMRSAAVRFVLSSEIVSSAILGPRTAPQLDQLVREASAEPPYLSAAKLDATEKRLKALDVPR